MVFEDLIKERWLEKRPAWSAIIGTFFTIISFGTSYFLFRQNPSFIGISTIFFTLVLVLPLVNKLFDLEEKKEAKEKLRFFSKHEHIIDFFIYYFVGVFIAFFIIAMASPDMVFAGFQQSVKVNTGLPPPPVHGMFANETANIIMHNLGVLVIAFILSLFYGAGALFLITLNASIFASALVYAVRTNLPASGFVSIYSFTLCNLGIMFLHMIPEVAGYLLAAIAGGVLSHAVIREKMGSPGFKSVLVDSIIIFLMSIGFIILAGILEIEVSREFVREAACHSNQWVTLLIFGIVLSLLVAFEVIRKKRK